MAIYYLYIDDRSVDEPMIGPFDNKGEAEALLFEYMSCGCNPANLIIIEEIESDEEQK